MYEIFDEDNTLQDRMDVNSSEEILEWEEAKATTRSYGTQTEMSTTCDVGTETQSTSVNSTTQTDTVKTNCKRIQVTISHSPPMMQFVDSLESNDKKCTFSTGLRFLQIVTLFNSLSPACENLTFWNSSTKSVIKKSKNSKLTYMQQLILVLVRLRAGLLVSDLSYRFGLSIELISRTFITWIQFMFNEFSTHLKPSMFPSRQMISEHLSKTFQTLKNIPALFDCTQFHCQSPSNFEQQGNLYSAYKSHTTFKVLVAFTPNGTISFVSDVFEGPISDREIFIRSKFVELLEPGDLIIGDRGFTVHDVVEEKQAHLNIPPFLKGRIRLSEQEEIETKKIAKQRIYIEHAIGRIKQFLLLQKVLGLNVSGTMNQIVLVCACLANFQLPIVLD